ncbi:hypothetical protein [Ethanoligenens sp.]|uniref:hypothetical protein n=1 Tax=Ethanoligenens sp. TaxID=2099655 RepID=UPI0039EAE950
MAKVGAIHALSYPAVAGRDATIHAGHNDTSTRPPTDLRGNPAVCAAFGKGAVLWSYDAAGQPQPEIRPCRGCVANTAEHRH